ncbi:MAG: phage tail protein [Deltaproteobacteria bacterium]|jgi:phage protein U|nr:phage tail protein [Deltaproteobacteria bacterium]
MFIGSLGPVIFKVSHEQIRTFRDLSRRRSAKSAKHDVLNGLPRLQHTGRDLDEISLTVVLERMSGHDYSPDASITALLEIIETGNEVPLMLGLNYAGLWFVQSVNPTHKIVQNGSTWRAEVAVSLIEYDLTPSLEAYAGAAAYALRGQAGDTALAAVSSAVGEVAGMNEFAATALSGMSGVIASGAASLGGMIADGVISLNGLVGEGLLDLNALVPQGLLDLTGFVPDGTADVNALVAEGSLNLDELVSENALDISGLVTSGSINVADLATKGAVNMEPLLNQGVADLSEMAAKAAQEVTRTIDNVIGGLA